MANDISADEARRMAEEIGLKRLTDEHVGQLARSTQAARARRASLRSETLTPADEPAHVYRLTPEHVR